MARPKAPGQDASTRRGLSAESAEQLKRELLFGSGQGASSNGRFQKGQSGNPKGRPKRSDAPPLTIGMQPTKGFLLSEAKRPVRVREGDAYSEISAAHALVRAIFNTALKGHPYAQRTLVERLDRLEREEACEVAEEHAFWEEYQDRCRSHIKTARDAGEVVPAALPHPDDIVIEPGRRVRITGPLDEEEAAKFDDYCRLRDALILQDALDCKVFEAKEGGQQTERPGGALLIAVVMNGMMPKRLQTSDAVFTQRMMQHEASSRRQLLKLVFQSWRALGIDRPRGMPFPPLEQIRRALEWRFALIAAFRRGELNAEAMRRGEFDEKARAFLEAWR